MATEISVRIKTAAILAVVVGAVICFAAVSAFGVVVAAIIAWIAVALACCEFARFPRVLPTNVIRPSIICASLMLAPSLCCAGIICRQQLGLITGLVDILALSSFLGGGLLGIVLFAYGRSSLEILSTEVASVGPALVHISCGGAALILLTSEPMTLLWVLIVISFGDSAAYFGGRAFGGVRLAPAISPNKTLSGSLFGLVAAILVGTILGLAVFPELSTQCCAALGLCTSIAGQLGDLVKSYLKRLHGVKDSGSLLPGHGGVYDRIDGYIAAAALVLLVQRWL